MGLTFARGLEEERHLYVRRGGGVKDPASGRREDPSWEGERALSGQPSVLPLTGAQAYDRFNRRYRNALKDAARPHRARPVFLELSGLELDAPEPELVEAMTATADGTWTEEDLASWIRGRSRPR